MKKLFLVITVLAFGISTTFAQVPEKAEDAKPIKAGEKVPTTKITSLEGEETSLEAIAKDKKSIVLFYRGGWCPYCNKHLSAIGESKDEIAELGYQIIGISPDAPSKLKKSVAKNKLDYELFSDSKGELITALGIAFKAPKKYGKMLLKYSENGNEDLLPVPTLLVVNTDGTVQYVYSNADYKTRMTADELLEVLNTLK